MSGKPNRDRRTERRQETQREIVQASWEVVREHGLAGLSMRDLGERVGMRAQSIYSYFASKNEIYDAMFLEGYEAFAAWMDSAVAEDEIADDPIGAARAATHAFVEFCTSDPVRYQLLFQRTIPDFTPSPEAYAVAVLAYEQMGGRLAAVGVNDQATLDLWTAVLTGITDQQISNDPGGTRWTQLVDRAVDMLIGESRANESTTTANTITASTTTANTITGNEKA
jgi:AcrR family transcriptional regulator